MTACDVCHLQAAIEDAKTFREERVASGSQTRRAKRDAKVVSSSISEVPCMSCKLAAALTSNALVL